MVYEWQKDFGCWMIYECLDLKVEVVVEKVYQEKLVNEVVKGDEK